MPDHHNVDLHVHSATLRLHVLRSRPELLREVRDVDHSVQLNVYELLSTDAGSSPASSRRRLAASRLVSLRGRHAPWRLEFELKDTVQDWVWEPHRNLGLEISCENHENINEIFDFALAPRGQDSAGWEDVLDSDSEEDMTSFGADLSDIPTLEVLTQERAIIPRQKRSHTEMIQSEDCTNENGENNCCRRYPVWISFADIGWDEWVIHPAGYDAFFCDGRCPHRYKSAHNFASVKSLLNMINPAAAPAPCCTATRLKPLTLLHYNEKGYPTTSVWEDMIVEECKCA